MRKMCAWAASRLLRCLDVEQQSALAVRLVRGLDDFPLRHTAWKALTHSGQEPVAQLILRECLAHYVSLEVRLSEALLGFSHLIFSVCDGGRKRKPEEELMSRCRSTLTCCARWPTGCV